MLHCCGDLLHKQKAIMPVGSGIQGILGDHQHLIEPVHQQASDGAASIGHEQAARAAGKYSQASKGGACSGDGVWGRELAGHIQVIAGGADCTSCAHSASRGVLLL